MKKQMLWLVCLAIAVSATGCTNNDAESGQKQEQASNTPVWRETETVATGRWSTIQNTQPSLYIFTPTHYAMMGTIGDRPQALYKALDPTTEEKIAAFDSFWGNSGTYEVTGDVVTIRPVVARNPNFMAGGFEKYQFGVDGDTLSLTLKSTDGHYRLSEEVVPDSRLPSEALIKLVRVL
jgi:hypothetical protein